MGLTDDYIKVVKVAASSKTEVHIEKAENMVKLFKEKYPEANHYHNELDLIIKEHKV